MADFSFPPPSFRGFNRQPFDSQFRRDQADPRAVYAERSFKGFPDFSDQGDDFSEDRSTFATSPRPAFPPPGAYTQQRSFSSGEQSTPVESGLESVQNRSFNPMRGNPGRGRAMGRPEDRNPDSPGRGYAYGRGKERQERDEDNSDRGNAYGRNKEEKAEHMKEKMLDKAKRKKAEKAAKGR